MPTVDRLLAIVVSASALAIAGASTPDGGVDPAQRGQQAVDDIRNRIQTNGQVAANLTPDERVMLLSGIICDAVDKVERARDTTKQERAKRPKAESIDGELLRDQDAVVRQQQSRISHARRELGRLKPSACKTADMRAVVRCIRGKSPFGGASSDCDIPTFWKYQQALMNLDSQWRDLLFPRDSRP